MHEQFKAAFDDIEATERLKRQTMAHIRRKTFDYGRQIQRVRARHRRLAASLVSLVLLLTGLGAWFTPATSIGVDINPSLELQVNIFDRVIALEGRNSDGEAVAGELDLTGKPYDEAMQRLLLSHGLAPYLEQGSTITITLAGSGDHAVQMLSKVVCRAYAVAQEENVVYCQVSWDTVKAAKTAGLCIPRYLAWQELRKTDPQITVEDIKEMPIEEIRKLIYVDTLENPCGE
jgi:hypothetical protein